MKSWFRESTRSKIFEILLKNSILVSFQKKKPVPSRKTFVFEFVDIPFSSESNMILLMINLLYKRTFLFESKKQLTKDLFMRHCLRWSLSILRLLSVSWQINGNKKLFKIIIQKKLYAKTYSTDWIQNAFSMNPVIGHFFYKKASGLLWEI